MKQSPGCPAGITKCAVKAASVVLIGQDMQVVNVGHAGLRLQEAEHCAQLNLARYGPERHHETVA